MAELRYRGREIREEDILSIRALIERYPKESRRKLSARICEAWQWRQSNGALRDMVCRGMLLMLERAGQVTLPPVTHKVDVRSVPDGASVFLDQRLVLGESPTTVEVTDDDFHELRIEKTGYETLTRPITPDDKAAVLQLALVPEKQPRGTLMVDANSAAEVWIDGVNTGYTTPTLGIEISIGGHTVEVRDGARRHSQVTHITIEQGQTLRLLLGAQNGAEAANGATPGKQP